MIDANYVAVALSLMAVGGTYYFTEFCNSMRIEHLIEKGKRWKEIKYKTPLFRFLVDKKNL